MKLLELPNLNDIYRGYRRGIYKMSLCNNTHDYMLVEDYMQKINYCIQDLNDELTCIDTLSPKSITYIISLVTWISEAMPVLRKVYRPVVTANFEYADEDQLQKAYAYMRALRSFAIAHPLTTTNHAAYGMDGSLMCIDIKVPSRTLNIVPDKAFYTLDHEGLHHEKPAHADFYLYAFLRKDEHHVESVHIGCTLRDIYRVADLYIDKLYALDRYLRKMTKEGRVLKS